MCSPDSQKPGGVIFNTLGTDYFWLECEAHHIAEAGKQFLKQRNLLVERLNQSTTTYDTCMLKMDVVA